MRPGHELERKEGRAARGRALVLEPSAQQLRLLVEAELADRAVGQRALTVVAAARGGLEVLVDLAPEVGERALVRQLGGAGGGVGERHAKERAAGPT